MYANYDAAEEVIFFTFLWNKEHKVRYDIVPTVCNDKIDPQIIVLMFIFCKVICK